MRIEEMLIKAAHFAGYLESGYDDDKKFCVGVPAPDRYMPWNPLEVDDHADELCKLGKFIIFDNDFRIDAHATQYDKDGAVAVQLVITELIKNHNDKLAARRMAVTKLAATLFDLRGVE